ncbi:hypothetical protein TcWFU_009309 [Taenia crassiceps]|uniref:Uncharacterized protein n=1 Tax=Taenia crassiceps TaxID=6207 RepID=A0ABR4QIQ0_9CEST
MFHTTIVNVVPAPTIVPTLPPTHTTRRGCNSCLTNMHSSMHQFEKSEEAEDGACETSTYRREDSTVAWSRPLHGWSGSESPIDVLISCDEWVSIV